jgi:hypothetical protein
MHVKKIFQPQKALFTADAALKKTGRDATVNGKSYSIGAYIHLPHCLENADHD